MIKNTKNTVTVKVPGTTANLGAGFDCIGAALSLYNHFKFTLAPELKITVKGTESEKVITDPNNLLYQSFVKFYEHTGKPLPVVAMEINLGVPLARGLGSSATAIVGGLMGANGLAGEPLELSEIIELAIALEGHPDNVVPALLGQCQLSVKSEKGWQICEIPWHEEIIPVVAIPDFELSTEQARSVLPLEISRNDAIYNIAHFGLLLRGLATNCEDWLKVALKDKLHQPYRQSLIKGYQAVELAALKAGAYGMVISGAGPTLLSLTPKTHQEAVVKAMKQAWSDLGVTAKVEVMTLDKKGAHVL